MASPYREAAEVPVRLDDVVETPPLATYDVSGARGANGAHGARGRDGVGSGEHGGRGDDAGPAVAGEDAGSIRLELVADADGVVAVRGELVRPGGERANVRDMVVPVEQGFVELRATGGRGGDGGNGGRGGDGARGYDGRDATRWSSGTNGGDGGDGGDGGNATSGEHGGAGGSITVAVNEDDTPLLMLLRHDVRGGDGGKAGANGYGGSGGAGGDGGDSYSWSETDYYTDSQGNRQSRTTWHSNSGGSDGSSGSSGRAGNARVHDGKRGADGAFAIEVKSEAGVKTYASRYDLRLVSFAHDSLNEDAVYEPRELVRVFDVEVENTGGMPTPKKDDLRLSLVGGGWVIPEPGDLLCAPGIEPGARHAVKGELRFRIKDFTPAAPADPLEVEESILHRAMLPSVHREFEGYQRGEAIEQGRFVIRFPIRLSPVQSLRSLVAGEATRVRFTVVNQSRFALGAGSGTKRVVRVRVKTSADSELGDEHVTFTAEGAEHVPSAGWVREIDTLDAGGALDLELTVRVRPGAPEYRRYAATISLELGDIDEPAAARAIQIRAFDIRVAREFQATDADLLLVVNHRTTREEIAAWEALAERLAFRIAIWDLTRERHLDLDAPVVKSASLIDVLSGGAIAILDNEIETPDGPAFPHAFLSSEHAVRAAAAGIDIAFIGKGPALDRVLIPAREAPRTEAAVFRRYWLRFWARPEQDWLRGRAFARSAELASSSPMQRHLVVHRFEPKLESQFLWIKKWKVGTLETIPMLDGGAGSLVHVALDDTTVHDPAYAISRDAAAALLIVFDFEEKLERLRRVGTSPDADDASLARIVDAILVDLAEELASLLAPGWRGGSSADELAASLPKLAALAKSGLSADYDSIAGAALLRLSGRLLFLADSQVPLWEAMPPLRWMRRAPAVRSHVADQVDAFLTGAFGEHNLRTTRIDAERISAELLTTFKRQRELGLARDRGAWALEQLRAPLAAKGITSHVELLTNHAERVMHGDEYDAAAKAHADAATRRAKLVSDADRAERDLLVGA